MAVMGDPASIGPVRRGLIVDWGGVLTSGVREAMVDWAVEEGVERHVLRSVLGQWLGPEYALEAKLNPIHALERGEMSVPDFEAHLAEAFERAGASPLRQEGLLGRMFSYFKRAPAMNGLMWRAKRAGVATALLSNSWGNAYPRDGWDDIFDVVVISGEVGIRKPEPAIFRLTCERLGVPARECVFVDDMAANVAAAEELGMAGVIHQDYAATAATLSALFGRRLG